MLGLAINNEYLDLNPGTILEIERQNPFLAFNEDITGEYSLPFEIKNTPRNIRLTKYAALLQQRVNTTGIDAIAYDGGLQDSIGKIKLEGTNHNLNRTQDGSISCYYLTGSSSFYQDVKEVKLRSIDVGGDRSFAWDDYNRSGNGFWGHIHKVIDAPAGTYDYAFYPVVNKSWQGEQASTEVMNWMEYASGTVNFKQTTTDSKGPNVIVPFPYLSYVLKQAAAHVGYRVEGAILSDPDFKKITLLSFCAISWASVSPRDIARDIVLGIGPVAVNPITFNLKDFLPDITIAGFFKALSNRFGWWLDFDRANKVIRIRSLSDVIAKKITDYTKKASPVIPKKIDAQKRVYALKQDWSGAPSDGEPNLAAVKYQGTINYVTNLQAASKDLYAYCYLVLAENNYYICRQNEDSGNWEWVLYAYNIWDYKPNDATEEITTSATTVGLEKYDSYLDFIPRMDVAGIWQGQMDSEATWGIHLLFYQGQKMNKSGQPVPLATSGIYDSTGQQVAAWSLCFQCKKMDGTEVGLYDRNWKAIMAVIAGSETLTVILYLSRIEYLKLNFGDVISIANTRMMVKKMKSTVPYSGKVELECNRL